jgi:hypothetical protein
LGSSSLKAETVSILTVTIMHNLPPPFPFLYLSETALLLLYSLHTVLDRELTENYARVRFLLNFRYYATIFLGMNVVVRGAQIPGAW